MPKMIDLTDDRFGRLLVIGSGARRNGRKTWVCRCDCGSTKEIPAAYLRHGGVQSCGCLRAESNAVTATARRDANAKRRNPLYWRWGDMIQRCENPNNPSWKNYGHRGIAVCDRWRGSFAAFIADMGSPPTTKHTIERINNDGGYSQDNCKWALRREQSRNQRRTILIEIDGKTMSAKDWASTTGISYQRITRAFRKNGILAAKAVIASAF